MLLHEAGVGGVLGIEHRPGVEVAVAHVADHDSFDSLAVEELLQEVHQAGSSVG